VFLLLKSWIFVGTLVVRKPSDNILKAEDAGLVSYCEMFPYNNKDAYPVLILHLLL
jgi:hypothetical protein